MSHHSTAYIVEFLKSRTAQEDSFRTAVDGVLEQSVQQFKEKVCLCFALNGIGCVHEWYYLMCSCTYICLAILTRCPNSTSHLHRLHSFAGRKRVYEVQANLGKGSHGGEEAV